MDSAIQPLSGGVFPYRSFIIGGPSGVFKDHFIFSGIYERIKNIVIVPPTSQENLQTCKCYFFVVLTSLCFFLLYRKLYFECAKRAKLPFAREKVL